MPVKIGINGFGRIGRNVLRIAQESQSIAITAINDLGSTKNLTHLFKYDSLYGKFQGDIKYNDEDSITVNGRKINFFHQMRPEKIPWKEYDVDIVIEATGKFKTRGELQEHLVGGAKKVILTTPGKDMDVTVVMGVNQEDLKEEHEIISNASCTTNALAPVVKVLEEKFGIEKGVMMTAHAYTNDQQLLDLPHDDPRRARAANLSIIPTTTGAAKAVSLVLPEVLGKLDGMAIRVPTPTVSLIDFVAQLKKKTNADEVNAAFTKESRGKMKGILGVSDEPLVSIDYKGSPYSTVVDTLSTIVMGDDLVKVISWYDNEWGYSVRVVDLVELAAHKMLAPASV